MARDPRMYTPYANPYGIPPGAIPPGPHPPMPGGIPGSYFPPPTQLPPVGHPQAGGFFDHHGFPNGAFPGFPGAQTPAWPPPGTVPMVSHGLPGNGYWGGGFGTPFPGYGAMPGAFPGATPYGPPGAFPPTPGHRSRSLHRRERSFGPQREMADISIHNKWFEGRHCKLVMLYTL
jgi:hypothetical protein